MVLENLLFLHHGSGEIILEISVTNYVSWASYKSRLLGGLVEQLQKGDILLVSDLNRLGRSLFEVMELLGRLMEKDVQVMSIKEGFEL